MWGRINSLCFQSFPKPGAVGLWSEPWARLLAGLWKMYHGDPLRYVFGAQFFTSVGYAEPSVGDLPRVGFPIEESTCDASQSVGPNQRCFAWEWLPWKRLEHRQGP